MKKIFTTFLLFAICSINFCFATEIKEIQKVQETQSKVKPFVILTDIAPEDLKHGATKAYEKANAAFIDWAKENLGYSQEEAEKLLEWTCYFSKLEPLPDAFYEMVSNENCKVFVEHSEDKIYSKEMDKYADMVELYTIYKKIRPDDDKYAKGIIASGNYLYYSDKVMSNEKLTDLQKVRKFERSVAFADIMNKSNGLMTVIYAPEEYGRYIKSYKYHSLPYKILSPIAVIPTTAINIAFSAAFVGLSVVALPYTLFVIVRTFASDAH